MMNGKIPCTKSDVEHILCASYYWGLALVFVGRVLIVCVLCVDHHKKNHPSPGGTSPRHFNFPPGDVISTKNSYPPPGGENPEHYGITNPTLPRGGGGRNRMWST